MTAFNFEQARHNMIEQQIRPWDVLDQRVLDTLAGMPREDFVPERYRNLAFSDVAIPLGHGEFMLKPNIEARILQALALQPTDKVLEIGTGSGYLTACLARLAASVVSVDIVPEFIETVRAKFKVSGTTIVLHVGDASQGLGRTSLRCHCGHRFSGFGRRSLAREFTLGWTSVHRGRPISRDGGAADDAGRRTGMDSESLFDTTALRNVVSPKTFVF